MERDFSDFKDKYGDGARTKFEDACRTLLQAMYPKEAHQVEVRQGDGGIDVFVGAIGQEPITVYQCKFFLSSIEKSQKDQIRKSFKTAAVSQEYQMKEWILCVPKKNFDLLEHQWWAKWKQYQETTYPTVSISLKTGATLIDNAKRIGVYNQIFDIEESLKIDVIHQNTQKTLGLTQDLFQTVLPIFSQTVKIDYNYIKDRLPSYLSEVVLALSQSIDYSIPTPSIHNLPQFERKIAYNDVKRYVWIIQQYGDFGSQLEEVYKTLNDEKPRIKQRIWNFIKTKYGKIKGELAQENPQQDIIEVVKQNADNIIDKVKQELEAGFYDSQMHIEDVEACLLTVIVDAFINCHILERPPES